MSYKTPSLIICLVFLCFLSSNLTFAAVSTSDTVSISQENGQNVIKEGDFSVKSTLPIEIKDNNLTVNQDGLQKTIIRPSQAWQTIIHQLLKSPTIDNQEFALESCPADTKDGSCIIHENYYQVRFEQTYLFFNILSIKSKHEYRVSAERNTLLLASKFFILSTLKFK
jgi:hypothetical protein